MHRAKILFFLFIVLITTGFFTPTLTFAADETSQTEMDEMLQKLASKKSEWARLDLPSKIALLDKMTHILGTYEEEWIQLSCRHKGITRGTFAEGEEILSGPFVVARNLRLLKESIQQLNSTDRHIILPELHHDGKRVVAKVFPDGMTEKGMYMGYEAYVRFQPDVRLEDVYNKHQATIYHKDPSEAASAVKVGVVLGAGNVSSIPIMDVLYKMFVEFQVVILKMHEVNDYLGKTFEAIFDPLIDSGYMAIAYGGPDVGKYLCKHSSVEAIHITGSHNTHNHIVYDCSAPQQSTEKTNNKPVTSELGNVSPVIVMPGNWSESEIEFQAKNIATMLTNNAGFNCNAVRVIVTSATWHLRQRFIRVIAQQLAQINGRSAYYPDAKKRYDEFVIKYPQAKIIGEPDTSGENPVLPWVLIDDLPSDTNERHCFKNEAFCGICAEVKIDDTYHDFLPSAVEFCNNQLWGTLNATIIVSPASYKEDPAEVEQAIDDLRYGTVSLNHWPGVSYGMVRTPWGSYPGNKSYNIQSGSGFVHNSYMLEGIEKVVMKGSFAPILTPIWFVNNATSPGAARALFYFEMNPGLWNTLVVTQRVLCNFL